MSSDFDFLIGEWRVINTRLKDWLSNCSKWVEFESEHVENRLHQGEGILPFISIWTMDRWLNAV